MSPNEQILDWELRLVKSGKRFSDVCSTVEPNVNPSVITTWRNRHTPWPEVTVLKALIEATDIDQASSLVYSVSEKSSPLHIWCRIENQIIEFEKAAYYARQSA